MLAEVSAENGQCGRTGSLPRSCTVSAPGGGCAVPLPSLLMVSLSRHKVLPERHMHVVAWTTLLNNSPVGSLRFSRTWMQANFVRPSSQLLLAGATAAFLLALAAGGLAPYTLRRAGLIEKELLLLAQHSTSRLTFLSQQHSAAHLYRVCWLQGHIRYEQPSKRPDSHPC